MTSASGAPVEGTTVNFAPGATSGTVSAAQATTNADGNASTSWTLGTEVGANSDTVIATVSGVNEWVTFTASVAAAAAASLEPVSGSNQTGTSGQPLAQPLVVMARDRFGNPKDRVDVTWLVTAGGGSISPAVSTTGADGRASAVWTVGDGANTAQAAGSGLTGSPVTFTATGGEPPSGVVTLTSITPAPIVEGQSATLTGTGFSGNPADNEVRIDGVDATVTAATATSLTIQVPAFNCQPARRAPVQVRVGNESSNVVSHDVNPGSFLSVGVGQQQVLQDPQQFCIQLAPSAAPEDYLIGVQSTSDVVSSLTPARLTARSAAAQTAALPLAELPRARATTQQHARPSDIQQRTLKQRAAAEARLRVLERQQVYPRAGGAHRSSLLSGLQRSAAIPPVSEPGDVIAIRYPGAGNICTSYIQVQMVVRVIGQHGIWLEDPENPAGGFTQADIQRMSDEFDSRIHTAVTGYFGLPTDLDANGRIAIALTKRVNELHPGVVGHVGLADLVPQSVCPSSDAGEIYYGIVPDPAGEVGDPVSREQVLAIATQTIAHEFTHIVQFGQRFILNDLPPQPSWVLEGQAMLGEEVTGHAYEGRSPGQNYGGAIAFNFDDPSSIDWYSQAFLGLFLYYGFKDPNTRVADAPEECSWLAGKPENPGPCVSGLELYGAPWVLLRWISDQFGANHAGGEKGLHQALIRSPATGYAALAAITGHPIKTLLAQWAATLYVDDRVPGSAPALQLPSWNLLDLENNVVETARLVPHSHSFSSFSDAFNVRAGSTAYFRVSGASRPGTAIQIRGNSDQPLPGIMQVFVVRLQ
ncbi:MAG TPA: Ig-like domain-containing protein [Gemmatimonadales bacterium]|nr:Ig-like domain-containing protein [Gemmatimonadales bacterium]